MRTLSIIVGLALLVAASVLAYVSANSGTEMLAKKEAIVIQYVDASEEALDDEDISKALKYAKLAIQANPKDRRGFISYENAMDAKYEVDSEEGSDTPTAEGSDESMMGC